MSQEITVHPVTVPAAVTPEAAQGQTAGSFFAGALRTNGLEPSDGDVLVVSSKLVSFFEGGLVRLEDVQPSRKARFLGRAFDRDPKKLQVLMETGRVLIVLPLKRILAIPSVRRTMVERSPNPEAMLRGFSSVNKNTFIVRTHAAYIDEAGIDHTNSPEEFVTLLPEDPCRLSREIREGIQDEFGVKVAVILTDTATSVGRVGSQDVAIGYSGIDPITRETFVPDLFGIPRAGGIDLVIDSISGMAGLVMGQTIEKTPIVVVRGLSYQPERSDELPGMEAVSWPAGTEWKFALLTIFSTLKLWFGNLIACQPKTKRSRVRS